MQRRPAPRSAVCPRIGASISAQFTPDGTALALNQDGKLCIRPVERYAPWAVLGARACSVGFAADGKTLTAVQRDDERDPWTLTVRRWDVAHSKSLAEWKIRPEPPRGRRQGDPDFRVTAWLAPDGRVVASLEADRSFPQFPRQVVRLYDAHDGRELRRWTVPRPPIDALVFSPDGRRIAAGSRDSTVRVWATASGKQVADWKTDRGGAVEYPRFHVGFAGDALVCTGPAGLGQWDWRSGKCLQEYPCTKGPFAVVAGGKGLAVQSMAGVLRVFDLATGAELYETAGPVNRIGFSADSRRIIWANDRMVRLVDARTGKEQRRWLEGRTTALPSVVQASGKHPASQVATGAPNTRGYILVYGDNSLVLESSATHSIVRRRLACYPGPLSTSPAFAPDSRTLITATHGGAQFWEIATGGQIAQRSAHIDGIRELIVSGDGRLLLTVGNERTALVWDLRRIATGDRPTAVLNDKTLTTVWDDLASLDAVRGRRAVETLAAAPDKAVTLLRTRCPPARGPSAKQLARLIADLDSDDFDRRQHATAKLASLGELAGPALRKAQAAPPSLEAKRRVESLVAKLDPNAVTPARVRAIRTVEVLEYCATAEARTLLQALAKGAAGARLTQEAQASLKRLTGR